MAEVSTMQPDSHHHGADAHEHRVRCVRLPLDSWPVYGETILQMERELFPEPLAQTEAELQDTLSDPRALFIGALEGERLAGFIAGETIKYYVEPGDPEYDEVLAREETLYIETLDVEKTRQGRGVGTALLKALLDEAAKRGYRHVVGHWREGASMRLAEKYGGKVLMVEPRYNGTSETYSYVVIDV